MTPAMVLKDIAPIAKEARVLRSCVVLWANWFAVGAGDGGCVRSYVFCPEAKRADRQS
jgi:hypothetical protein